MEEEQIDYCKKSKLSFVCDDITGGVSGEIFQYFFQKINTTDSAFDILEGLEKKFKSIVLDKKNFSPKGYPSVRQGFSLMTHTSTLVPLQEVFESFVRNKKYSVEESIKIEKELFKFLKQYNSWLLSFSIENWFLRNPEGELNIITDIGKFYYKNNIKKTVNNERRYENINLSLFKDLQDEFLVDMIDNWNWEDEEDHFHHIYAISIKKK